ncbi:hypothetical protein BJ138DRAFT_910109, partial [Hygrophoropsis aurantiaca]
MARKKGSKATSAQTTCATTTTTNPDALEVRRHLSFLAHDLRTFTTNPAAQARLYTSIWPHAIGPPYLAEAQVHDALALTLPALRQRPPESSDADSRTLQEFMAAEVEKIIQARRRKHDAPDFELCTSHDLAPLIQAALGLEKGFHEAKAFRREYKGWEKRQRVRDEAKAVQG